MDVRTYRASSLQEALRQIREELGPDAAVLHTREVAAGMLGGWFGGRRIEVTASNQVQVPSRLPPVETRAAVVAAERVAKTPAAIKTPALVKTSSAAKPVHFSTPSHAQRQVFQELVDGGMGERLARELIAGAERIVSPEDRNDLLLLQGSVVGIIENQLAVRGPIQLVPGCCQRIALVGPTGVGKTTTIAKLAANFRLREKCRVGLITVDTFRIAAVEQLRTYAEIIDLPMEVVSTPQEMKAATQRLADFDLVLIDTVGRSSRDEIRIHELRKLLAEARADEIHLVLSSVTASDALAKTVERFASIGASHLILSKIDEAYGLGGLYPVLQSCRLPLSYLTDGQNVPHDIRGAERRWLARRLAGQDADATRGASQTAATIRQA